MFLGTRQLRNSLSGNGIAMDEHEDLYVDGNALPLEAGHPYSIEPGENVGYTGPGGASNSATFVANNAHLRAVAASGQHPALVLADCHSYTHGRSSWFAYDGVHFSAEGARQSAMYLSRKLAFLERRPCPSGIGGATAPGGWCADPDLVGPS